MTHLPEISWIKLWGVQEQCTKGTCYWHFPNIRCYDRCMGECAASFWNKFENLSKKKPKSIVIWNITCQVTCKLPEKWSKIVAIINDNPVIAWKTTVIVLLPKLKQIQVNAYLKLLSSLIHIAVFCITLRSHVLPILNCKWWLTIVCYLYLHIR